MLKDDNGVPLNNERLEYLGDAVLGTTIAHDLFVKFPNKDEGQLTKIRSRIVNRSNLNTMACNMGLDKLIQTKPRNIVAKTHIPGDALEALIGAIFLDLGSKYAQKFIRKKIIAEQINLSEIIETDTNYKSLLVEWGQKYKYDIHYITEEFSSPMYERLSFKAQVFANEMPIGEGKGNAKKEAQQNAACKAFETLREKFPNLTI